MQLYPKVVAQPIKEGSSCQDNLDYFDGHAILIRDFFRVRRSIHSKLEDVQLIAGNFNDKQLIAFLEKGEKPD